MIRVPIFRLTRKPFTVWRQPFACPSCQTEATVAGVVRHREVWLFWVIPIPLWRDWLVVCEACGTSWDVDRDDWADMRDGAPLPP